MTDTDQYAELEAALAPLRAAQPGISNQEAAALLPPHLEKQLWERAVDRYLNEALAGLDAEEAP
ncbi:hypothetical protein [Actinoplanes rectilineatus]|uniref:hypothetical protein n=1 Tax=Actinoplanes rectilineatus TaxID=113571 RepID=UPI0005F282E3|nr:hypothetical protein [Actinoplanes rectilineatus]